MALTTSQKSCIESKKRSIESLKLDIKHLMVRKKQISEKYAGYIKSTKDAARKSGYRASKISDISSVNRDIERKKMSIENFRKEIARIKA